MNNLILKLVQRKLADLLDEVATTDEPSFSTEQVDLLEKRFFEIQHAITDQPHNARRLLP